MSHTALGGTYTSKKGFRAATLAALGEIIDPDYPMRLRPINVIGGGNEEWATVELRTNSKSLNGTAYDQTYAWCTRWKPLKEDEDGKIVQVHAYLDTALLDKVVDEGKKSKI